LHIPQTEICHMYYTATADLTTDDSYEQSTQTEPQYSLYAFTYTLDETYIMAHTILYTPDQ